MKTSGSIFCLIFLFLYCCKTSLAIYDPRETHAVKPARRREPVIPRYVSSSTTGFLTDPQISRKDESIDLKPREPIVVRDGSRINNRYEIPYGEIEQQSVTDYHRNHKPGRDVHGHDWTGLYTNQNNDQNGFFGDGSNDNEDNQKSYEDFALEVKKPYKDTQDFTIERIEPIKIAKYDLSTSRAECPTSDATGQFVYPFDCKFFVNCWNGRAFIQPCAPGTLFNPDTLECDFPGKVKCYNTELKDLTNSHYVPPSPKKQSLQFSESRRKFEIPRLNENPTCPPWITGLIPHPNDCTKFLQCANGVTYIMDCGPGTVFNPTFSVCDWPYNVKGCEDALKSNLEITTVPIWDNIDKWGDFTQPTLQVPPTESNIAKCPNGHEGLVPHPRDCKKFLQCNNGNTYVLDCAPGTVFNPITTSCDFPYNVEGCGKEEVPVTETSHQYGNNRAYGQRGDQGWDQRFESTQHIGLNSAQNVHQDRFSHRQDNTHNSEGSHTNIGATKPSYVNGQSQNTYIPQNQNEFNQNIYVDANFKLPEELENVNENGNREGKLFTTSTPWYHKQSTATTAKSVIHGETWSQIQTNIHQPPKFKPSNWRGQGRNIEPSAEDPSLRGAKAIGVNNNKNVGVTNSMTIHNALHSNSMFNNKSQLHTNTAINSNAYNLFYGNKKPYFKYYNYSDAKHFSLTNGYAVPHQLGHGKEYWRITEGNVNINETYRNIFHNNCTNNITSSKGMINSSGIDMTKAISFRNHSSIIHRNTNNNSQIYTPTKFHSASNNSQNFSSEKIGSSGNKESDLDLKLDQWLMRPNSFNQNHNLPGTKLVRQEKEFSVTANGKSDNGNSNNLNNKKWYPNRVYVNSNGIKGHYITKEIKINQGHSNMRHYSNKNGINPLGEPNNSQAPHEKPMIQNFDAIIKETNNQSLDGKFDSKFHGATTNDNDHIANPTYDLSAMGTNNYFGTTEKNNLENTTEKNIPYTVIKFASNNNKQKKLNETNVKSIILNSSILVTNEASLKDVKHDVNHRKPELIFKNRTTVDSKSSVVMKVPKGKVDLDIFGVEVVEKKEEPPFPVYYVPPVQPLSYSNEITEITPTSGQVLRLRGGLILREGYLEVQGTQPGWGIVCDRSAQWTLKEANIVCRQLGYLRGAEMAWQGKPIEGEEPLWIAADSVECAGNETYFQHCKFTHNSECDVARDAVGIRCTSNRLAYCKKDEIPHQGFCYHLADPSTALNHVEALDYCNNRGSKLLDIIDQSENNFISEWLVQTYPDVKSVMTSGFGFTTWNRTLWVWEDSNHAKFRFTKWWPGWMLDKQIHASIGARPACVIMKRIFPCHNRPDESCITDYFFWDVEDCAASSKGHSSICKRSYDDIGCVYGKGQHYLGKANITESGAKCLPWADESVQQYLKFKVVSEETREKLKEHNYCRNPNPNREIKPWCFTGPRGEYEHCDIPSCAKQGVMKSVAVGQCNPKHFECTPGECIPSPWICDGEEDCTNGADEQACSQHLEYYTKIEHHRLDGHDIEKWLNTPLKTCALRCKEADFTCRSFSHKADGNICLLSDSNVGLTGALQPSEEYDYYEMNERSINCSDMFICGNQKCINQSLVCNGKNNCGDRTDESICDLENLGYEIRLSGSNNTEEGRLEIKVWEQWGQVCDDGFGMIAANIACKELGFPLGAREIRSAGFYNEGEFSIFLMDQVKCRGNETSLRECDFDGWGVHDCLPEEAVGIVCKTAVNICPDGTWKCDNSPECIPTPFICDEVEDCSDHSDESPEHCEAPFQLRLVGGSSSLEGRVEVRHHGIWGTVCDDDFTDANARVICRSLGYGGTASSIKDGVFGPGEGPIWLDQISCSGNETQLYRCDHEHWGRHNCGHDEDVGVRCEPGEVTLDEKLEEPVSNQLNIRVSDILPADCGMRFEDFDENDEYMAKVVQGSIAPKGAYPWQASIRVRGHSKSNHWCGAVIISPLHVLTAAHCLEGYNKGLYFVRAGDYNTEIDDGTEVEANIEDYYIHEDFRKGQRMNNDIAVVLLKGQGIPLGRRIMPICLPPENIEYLPGLNCTISGWGSIESGNSVQSNFLRFGWVPILDNSVCRADYVYGEGAISDGMVCAGYLNEGVDSCDGDSGGPLACHHNNAFTLYGLTSWGKRCGETNKPGVYVRVAHYRRWIDRKLQESLSGR